MKLEDYQHLEALAAKRGAILVEVADLLAWREELERLRERNALLEDRHERLTNHNNILVAAVRTLRELAPEVVAKALGEVRQ